MRILDRSSRHGEGLASGHRYERIQARETIEHIREFLAGTAEVAISHPADESARRIFVATVLKRYRYVGLSKGPRGVLFAYMDATPDGVLTPAFVSADRAVPRHPVDQAIEPRQSHQLHAYLWS